MDSADPHGTRWSCQDCWWTYPSAALYEAHREHCDPHLYRNIPSNRPSAPRDTYNV